MKCFECGGELTETRETVRNHRLGLTGVVLRNVPVRRCAKCKSREVVYPQIASLHRLLANALVAKKTRLTGEEIRFLRKYLGWSGADLARRIGVASETVSRWENGHEPVGVVPDRTIRLMLRTKEPVEDYALETAMDSITLDEPVTESLQVELNDAGYELATA